MGIRIITNNPEVHSKYSTLYNVDLIESDYLGVLLKIRDMVHLGFKVYTHPLSGSIKPNETPYKSVLVSDSAKELDMDSLQIIESSIQTTEKFLRDRPTPNWNDEQKRDFQIVDLSLIDNAIQISGF